MNSYGPQAEKHGRINDLRPAQGNRGAGERSDQESQALRRFLLRGLETVDAEWNLNAVTNDLLKLFRYR